MARKNKLVKTSKSNIYYVLNKDNKKEFVATFRLRGTLYEEKNLTRHFGVKNLTHAVEILADCKADIRNNINPFIKDKRVDTENFYNSVIKQITKQENFSHETDYKSLTDYQKGKLNTFNKYMKDKVTALSITDVNAVLLIKIFKKLDITKNTVDLLKKSMRSTFTKAMSNGKITFNPLDDQDLKDILKEKKETEKPKLSKKIKKQVTEKAAEQKAFIKLVQSLYKTIMTFEFHHKSITDNEFKIAFLLALMCARRRGEILNTTYEHFDTDYNIDQHALGYEVIEATKDITKSKIDEEYPVPKEVVNLLQKDAQGKIVNITDDIYSNNLNKVIEKADLNLKDNFKITGHDFRHIFISIMSHETKNPFLCDYCLSHRRKENDILLTYYTPAFDDRVDIFKGYWKILRN